MHKGESNTNGMDYLIIETRETVSKLYEKFDTLVMDIGIIKNTLKGNGSEGLVQKVDRHDKWFWAVWGIMGFISVLFSVISFLKR